MNDQLPLNARPIFVTWYTDVGGIGVTARTNDRGQPIIGLYPLNNKGQPTGWPCEFPRERLMLDMVVGYRNGKAVTVFIDVTVDRQGLDLRLCLPFGMQDLQRHIFTRWGSNALTDFEGFPDNCNWLTQLSPAA